MKDDNGVRPVGVGETIRRIIGKCVLKIVGSDVQLAAGALQTCAGIQSGIEAAIHAMGRAFQDERCEAVILVDADNAFNRLNRKVALHNIKQMCPAIHTFLNNSYKVPARLHLGDGTFINSEEGATQGDNLAMAMYALSTRKIIASLKSAAPDVKQVWFADDSAGAAKLDELKVWWDHLNYCGPAYGYFPKPAKTHIIVKSPELLEKAEKLFGGEGVHVTSDGERHIGAVVGSAEFKEQYVRKKVKKWTEDVKQLSTIAQEEPQAALSAFNIGLSQRWKFLQRTISETGQLFEPLERSIREELIPALVGRGVSDIERRIFALPYRYGGMGILNPTETAAREYAASREITSQLSDLIYQQELDISLLDKEEMENKKSEMRGEKEESLKKEHEQISAALGEKERRLFHAAQEKGASAWLSALPIKRIGYSINKQEFRDAICLRYGWSIPDMPKFCGCGQRNSLDHVLICKRGGYVSMRHNILRDTEARMLQEVCKDVKTEPEMIPTVAEMATGNVSNNARLDISARGVWSRYEKTFFDIRVTHPTADSHMTKSLEALYTDNEKQKKRAYNDRVINIEKATFTPLVFTTTGGMGPECQKFNKRLAELISQKQREEYSHVMRHIRCKLRFSLLKATLAAVRGVRGKVSRIEEDDITSISFNLIPQEPAYESY